MPQLDAWERKTNSALPDKLALRARATIPSDAVVIETHAGYGSIHERAYAHVRRGVAIDLDPTAAAHLAATRPTWLVLEAHAAHALAGNIPTPGPVDVLDIDPTGDPWPTVQAALQGRIPKSDHLHLFITDGLRLRLRAGNQGALTSLYPHTLQHGIRPHNNYTQAAETVLKHILRDTPYALTEYHATYAGRTKGLTLIHATLERTRS